MSWRNYPLLLFVPPEMNCEPFLQLLYQFRVLFTTGLLAAVHKPSTWSNLTDRITGYTQTRGTAHYYYYYYYYYPSSIGTTARCGLWPVELYPSNFFIRHKLSPSSHSQHLKISFYFLFPSFPGSSPSPRPFQFLSEDLFGHPILPILSRWPNHLILFFLSIFIYFLLCSYLLVLDSSYFSIPRFRI